MFWIHLRWLKEKIEHQYCVILYLLYPTRWMVLISSKPKKIYIKEIRCFVFFVLFLTIYSSEIYSPAKEGNPDVCFRSSFLRNSENEAGVTSSPALAGENSKIPAPLSRISSSEESSKDMDIAGPSSPSRSRLRRRVREGWKLNSGTWSSCPVKQSSDHLLSLTFRNKQWKWL